MSTIEAPTDPQVHVWFVVDCGNGDCGSFEEGAPASEVSEAEALANALGDWNMQRGEDGKLYCESCTDQAAEEKICASHGHQWKSWNEVPGHGAWPSMAYRSCQCGVNHEQRRVSP